MMRKYLAFFFFFWIGHSPLVSGQVTLYVSPSGKDINSGSRDQPLASLQAARDRVRALRKKGPMTGPVVIRVAPGRYTMTAPLELTAEDAGTVMAPLIFRGDSTAPAFFSGGELLPAFERVSDRLWKVRVPGKMGYPPGKISPGKISPGKMGDLPFEQLYVGNERATRARTPNEGFFYKVVRVRETVSGQGASVAGSGLATQRITLRRKDILSLPAPDSMGASGIVVSFFHNWDVTRKYIQQVDRADSTIVISGTAMLPWNPIDDKSLCVFENARAFLDQPGEWFLDPSGDLYYIPREGETIAKTRAEAPRLENFILLHGEKGRPVEHIRFEHIGFGVTADHMPSSGYDPVQAAAPVPAAILIDHARDIRFTDCEITHTGAYGCWFRSDCRDCSVVHCYLHDLGAGGIKLGETTIPADTGLLTRQVVVDNNIIRGGGRVWPAAVAMLILNASDNIVTHNEIADFFYSGVSVGWVWGYKYSPSKRNTISFNHIHHLGWGLLSDMGGVYLLGPSEGTTVNNNIIHDVFSRAYGGWGLYTDEGSTGISLKNNLVYHCKSAAFHQHYGKDNIVSNNIFISQVKAQLQATRVEDHLSFRFVHNIIYFDGGQLVAGSWAKIRMVSDSNCYWKRAGGDIRFDAQSFSEWQGAGKDRSSVVADPLFAGAFTGLLRGDAGRGGDSGPGPGDGSGGDSGPGRGFVIGNKSLLTRIGFGPIDYNKTGVDGSPGWIRLARLDEKIQRRFAEMVKANSD